MISDNNFLTKSQKFKLKKNNIKFIEINKWLEEKKSILVPENTSLNKLNLHKTLKHSITLSFLLNVFFICISLKVGNGDLYSEKSFSELAILFKEGFLLIKLFDKEN